jgi:hypothetical protein
LFEYEHLTELAVAGRLLGLSHPFFTLLQKAMEDCLCDDPPSLQELEQGRKQVGNQSPLKAAGKGSVQGVIEKTVGRDEAGQIASLSSLKKGQGSENDVEETLFVHSLRMVVGKIQVSDCAKGENSGLNASMEKSSVDNSSNNATVGSSGNHAAALESDTGNIKIHEQNSSTNAVEVKADDRSLALSGSMHSAVRKCSGNSHVQIASEKNSVNDCHGETAMPNVTIPPSVQPTPAAAYDSEKNTASKPSLLSHSQPSETGSTSLAQQKSTTMTATAAAYTPSSELTNYVESTASEVVRGVKRPAMGNGEGSPSSTAKRVKGNDEPAPPFYYNVHSKRLAKEKLPK